MKIPVLSFAFFFIAHFQLSAQPAWKIIPPTNDLTYRYALVIGNENYQIYADRYTDDVLHSIYDAEKFRMILERNKLVAKSNISFYPDALSTHIKLMLSRIVKLKSQDQDKIKAELIVYFNGKISYDEKGKLYLVPIDATENEFFFSMSVDELCDRIDDAEIAKAWIFVDATKAGNKKTESLLSSLGEEMIPPGNHKAEINIFLAGSNSIRNYRNALKTEIDKEDYKAPDLIIESPVNEDILGSPECMIYGKATDLSGVFTVAVNGEEAHLNVDGSFSAKTILEVGENSILVEAFDEFHNRSERIISVDYRPEKTVEKTPEESTASFFAVLIGVTEYKDPMVNDLKGPVEDLTKLSQVLNEQYNFKDENIFKMYNATSFDIIDTLKYLEKTLTPDDNLIIVFSGHGVWDEASSKGYWLPADAEAGNNLLWLSNSKITAIVSSLPTKHTLVIADACFSGGIFRTRGLPSGAGMDILQKYESPSRNAMTSGDLNEVPDKSAFMFYMIKYLKENREKFVTAEDFYYKLKIPVMESTENIPQFGKIKNSGDQGGDFVFVNRKTE
ncbi:MAG: caspase family protein [Bacteroidales bacterium]|nr:caspase family protein [Bacteroidales bacterium]MCF8389082.1 caspase family protein [Bacteroidales bacterium]